MVGVLITTLEEAAAGRFDDTALEEAAALEEDTAFVEGAAPAVA
jgi:hypothetical protein